MSAHRPPDLGTRVRFNALTGTIADPDSPVTGQPRKGYRPPYEAVWIYLDPEHWDTQQPGVRGTWVAADSPELVPATEPRPPRRAGSLIAADQRREDTRPGGAPK